MNFLSQKLCEAVISPAAEKSALRLKTGITGRMNIDIPELEKVIREELNDKERKIFERFWGLTGECNYCQMWIYATVKGKKINPAVDAMHENANGPFRKILDLEAVKYLILYMVFMKNGARFYNEKDTKPISAFDDSVSYLSGYIAVNELCEKFAEYGEESISMKMILSFIEMMDLKYVDIMKKSLGLKLDEIDQSLMDKIDMAIMNAHGLKWNVSAMLPAQEIPTLEMIADIRQLKQTMFTNGPWNATWQVISGKITTDGLMDFFKSPLRKNLSGLPRYQTGVRGIYTFDGQRNVYKEVPVYCVGGIEFTDPREIEFLYLECD